MRKNVRVYMRASHVRPTGLGSESSDVTILEYENVRYSVWGDGFMIIHEPGDTDARIACFPDGAWAGAERY